MVQYVEYALSVCSSVRFTCPMMQKVAKEQQLTMVGLNCLNNQLTDI